MNEFFGNKFYSHKKKNKFKQVHRAEEAIFNDEPLEIIDRRKRKKEANKKRGSENHMGENFLKL
jgi:hypothetical protein